MQKLYKDYAEEQKQLAAEEDKNYVGANPGQATAGKL